MTNNERKELKRAELAAQQDDELALLASRAKGPLTAKRVVNYARNPSTALHQVFEWDDSVAATKYRLWQAHELIVTRVVLLEQSDGEPLRVRRYLHLPSENGYRPVQDVLGSEAMKKEIAAHYRQRIESLQRDARNIALLVKDPLYAKVQQALEEVPAQVA